MSALRSLAQHTCAMQAFASATRACSVVAGASPLRQVCPRSSSTLSVFFPLQCFPSPLLPVSSAERADARAKSASNRRFEDNTQLLIALNAQGHFIVKNSACCARLCLLDGPRISLSFSLRAVPFAYTNPAQDTKVGSTGGIHVVVRAQGVVDRHDRLRHDDRHAYRQLGVGDSALLQHQVGAISRAGPLLRSVHCSPGRAGGPAASVCALQVKHCACALFSRPE